MRRNSDKDTFRSPLKFLIYFHTIRFLKPVQVYGRVWVLLKRGLLNPLLVWWVSRSDIEPSPPAIDLVPKPFNETLLKCEVSEWKFVFLNRQEIFRGSINWNNPRMEKLWLYNLHYFEYLLPLGKEHSAQNFETGRSIILRWIKDNPIGFGNGWESYPISLRIVNWIFFFNRYYHSFEKDDNFRIIFLKNLYRQVLYLKFNLEIHLLANHLFENIKGLLFGAMFFQDRKLFERTWKLFRREIREQILEDGGHYEQSPMYHSIILTDIVDILNLFRGSSQAGSGRFLSNGQTDISFLENTARKMLQWLTYMIHPDGEIALFGDSAMGIAPRPIQVTEYFSKIIGKESPSNSTTISHSLEQSGYFIFHDTSQHLVVDFGELGVRYQPGHVHCDLLSYEYSFNRTRFIVDSGVGSYQDVELRNKARSTFSHNTVVVNGMEQAELWKIHRVGRWVENLSHDIVKDEKVISFYGEYENRIEQKNSYRHHRTISYVGQRFFCIKDEIGAASLQSAESLVHFHPNCKIDLVGDIIQLTVENNSICILWNNKNVSAEVREWFFIPEFGKLINTNKLVLRSTLANKTELAYVIAPLAYFDEARRYLSKDSNWDV